MPRKPSADESERDLVTGTKKLTELRERIQQEMRRQKPAEPAAKSSGQRPPRPVPGLKPIAMKLPVAYFRILDIEADRLGVPRSHFLTMLASNKLGLIKLARNNENAPEYTFSDQELTETRLYLWYCKPEIRQMVDEDRKQMGLNSFNSWVNIALN